MKTMKEKYSDKKASFVENIDELKKVNDITELKNLINQCRENKEPLTNLNLSGVELKNIDMSVLDIVNVVFNTIIMLKTLIIKKSTMFHSKVQN